MFDNDIDDPDYREKLYKEIEHNNAKYEDSIRISFRKCTENVHARRVLYEIFKWCGVFNAAVPNEEKLAHAEGRRLIGIQLKDQLDDLDFELFFDLMKEGIRYEEAIRKTRELSAKF